MYRHRSPDQGVEGENAECGSELEDVWKILRSNAWKDTVKRLFQRRTTVP